MINRIRLRHRHMHGHMHGIRRRDVDSHGYFDGHSDGDLIRNLNTYGHFDGHFADLAHRDLVDDGDFAVDCAFWRAAARSGTGGATGFGDGAVAT